MQNLTHFWFAFACILSYNVIFNHFLLTEQLLLLPWIVFFSFISLCLNFFDKYFCLHRKTRTCIDRCRHPATHSPFTLFLLVITLRFFTISFSWPNFIIEAFTLAIGSHLLLDILSQEGIPLGFTPTLFVQDSTKNYVFNDHSKPRMKLHLPSNIFSRDNWETNHYISLGSKIIILFLYLQLLLDFKGGIM